MPDEGRFKPAGTIPGLVFVPAPRGPKKHPCPECFECLWCPDSRCAACRSGCGAQSREPGGEGQDDESEAGAQDAGGEAPRALHEEREKAP